MDRLDSQRQLDSLANDRAVAESRIIACSSIEAFVGPPEGSANQDLGLAGSKQHERSGDMEADWLLGLADGSVQTIVGVSEVS